MRLPDSLTFLPTYDCTAACENCCFGSHPGIGRRLPLDRILHHIDEAAALGSVQLVVFSGGECFTLGDDLTAAVARCTQHGLATRCVSNGYWAKTEEQAKARLEPLVAAGLGELNVSTGDAHQRYVPLKNVVNAMRAATSFGLSALVVVEAQEKRRFTLAALREDPRWAEMLAGDNPPVAFESPWMSMDQEHPVTQAPGKAASAANLHRRAGCDSVLRTVVVTPEDRLGACCGLTREQIPELDLGSLQETPMTALVKEMTDDFLKIWLAVDGPAHIVAWAAEHDPGIAWEGRFAHHCDACLFMYSDAQVRRVIAAHWEEVADDVLYRFAASVSGAEPR
jgi:hypothetical protein